MILTMGAGVNDRMMHVLRVGAAVAIIGAFLVAVGVSLATGREPSLVISGPTMFVLTWLYRATKKGDDEA